MAIGSKIVLSWPPGSCGDMVRSCLYPLMHKGNWEYRQWEEHETPIFGWNTSGTGNAQNPKALVWNNNLISYNDNLGKTKHLLCGNTLDGMLFCLIRKSY